VKTYKTPDDILSTAQEYRKDYGGPATINPGGGWEQNGTIYTLSGSGPTISITVKMGAGTLNLETEYE